MSVRTAVARLTLLALSFSAFGLGAVSPVRAASRDTLRERVAFTTPKGEAASLELWVRNGVMVGDGPADELDVGDCPGGRLGMPMSGVYSLRLVISGRVVNTVQIPGLYRDAEMQFPLRNLVVNNWLFYGGRKPRDDADGRRLERTHLMNLRDVTGDGLAYEFRLLADGACSHAETLLAGYSPRRGRAVVFQTTLNGQTTAWPMDLFPDPSSRAKARLSNHWGCYDHGQDVDSRATYVFDRTTEVWKGTEIAKPCPPDA